MTVLVAVAAQGVDHRLDQVLAGGAERHRGRGRGAVDVLVAVEVDQRRPALRAEHERRQVLPDPGIEHGPQPLQLGRRTRTGKVEGRHRSRLDGAVRDMSVSKLINNSIILADAPSHEFAVSHNGCGQVRTHRAGTSVWQSFRR